MTKTLECVVDLDGSFLAGKSTTVIESEVDLCWLLGILNSRLMSFYYLSVFGGDRLQGGYLRIGPPQLRTLPVPEFDQQDLVHRSLADHVHRLLGFYERPVATTPLEAAVIARQAQGLEAQIDELVYRIYELTDAERLVIEQSLEPLAGT